MSNTTDSVSTKKPLPKDLKSLARIGQAFHIWFWAVILSIPVAINAIVMKVIDAKPEIMNTSMLALKICGIILALSWIYSMIRIWFTPKSIWCVSYGVGKHDYRNALGYYDSKDPRDRGQVFCISQLVFVIVLLVTFAGFYYANDIYREPGFLSGLHILSCIVSFFSFLFEQESYYRYVCELVNLSESSLYRSTYTLDYYTEMFKRITKAIFCGIPLYILLILILYAIDYFIPNDFCKKYLTRCPLVVTLVYESIVIFYAFYVYLKTCYDVKNSIKLYINEVLQKLNAIHWDSPEFELIDNADFQIGQYKDDIYLLRYSGQDSSVTIPDGVTEIADYAFANCKSIKSVVIPESVSRIGIGAFYSNWKLSFVSIPQSVSEIREITFADCTSLTSVVIPEGVTAIEYGLFTACESLTSVVIPQGVTEIGEKAFFGCKSLSSIVIPQGVTTIGFEAFLGCSSLKSVSISKGLTEIKSCAFKDCSSLASIVIPEGITSLGNWTFECCTSLESITIPNSVSYIDNYTFSRCPKLTIQAPTGSAGDIYAERHGIPFVPSIYRDDSFEWDGTTIKKFIGKETNVVIPEGATKIDTGAFYRNISITSVTIPEGVTSIGRHAFEDCHSLESVVIPQSVSRIGGWAFIGCKSLLSVDIPEGVTVIEELTFDGCLALTSAVIPKSVTKIEEKAFFECRSLTSLVIPDGVTSIGENAFGLCTSLKKVTIPGSISKIKDWAFTNCSSLTSLEISEGVVEIGVGAFSECKALASVSIPSSLRKIGKVAFEFCRSLTTVHIPYGIKPDWTLAYLIESATIDDIPQNVLAIGRDAFIGCPFQRQ